MNRLWNATVAMVMLGLIANLFGVTDRVEDWWRNRHREQADG